MSYQIYSGNLLVQSTATAIPSNVSLCLLTTTTANCAFVLPASMGYQCTLLNKSTQASAIIFPPSGGAINSSGTNNSLLIAPNGGTVNVICTDGLNYVANEMVTRSRPVVELSANATLTLDQSNSIFECAAGTYVVSLPVGASGAGWNGDFYMKANGTGVINVGSTGAANMNGYIVGGSTGSSCAGKSFVNFASTSLEGDHINVVSNGLGTVFVNAQSAVNGGITTTA